MTSHWLFRAFALRTRSTIQIKINLRSISYHWAQTWCSLSMMTKMMEREPTYSSTRARTGLGSLKAMIVLNNKWMIWLASRTPFVKFSMLSIRERTQRRQLTRMSIERIAFQQVASSSITARICTSSWMLAGKRRVREAMPRDNGRSKRKASEMTRMIWISGRGQWIFSKLMIRSKVRFWQKDSSTVSSLNLRTLLLMTQSKYQLLSDWFKSGAIYSNMIANKTETCWLSKIASSVLTESMVTPGINTCLMSLISVKSCHTRVWWSRSSLP